MTAYDTTAPRRFDSAYIGHALQLVVFICSLLGAVWYLRGEIAAQQNEVALVKAELARLTSDFNLLRADLRDKDRETRLTLQNVTDRLTDIRLSIKDLPTPSPRR